MVPERSALYIYLSDFECSEALCPLHLNQSEPRSQLTSFAVPYRYQLPFESVVLQGPPVEFPGLHDVTDTTSMKSHYIRPWHVVSLLQPALSVVSLSAFLFVLKYFYHGNQHPAKWCRTACAGLSNQHQTALDKRKI